MTRLRQRMIEDMQLRGLSPNTQVAYVQALSLLARHYGKSPDQRTDEELRQYFLYLRNEKQVSRSTSTITLCALKFLYEQTLRCPWPILDFIRAPKEQKLPVVLSIDEVRRANLATTSLTHTFTPPVKDRVSLTGRDAVKPSPGLVVWRKIANAA